MVQTAFLSRYEIDEQKIVRIQLSQFFVNVAFDIGLIIVAFILWRYLLWVPIQKMKIPNLKTGVDLTIGPDTSTISIIKHIRALLKQMIGMGDNTIIKRCGYQYFTYIFFLRRLCLLMGILIITDFCVWIPYCLFFQPIQKFSLVTMDSTGNSQFRTFYTIWVSCIMLYGLYDLKSYLSAKFMHRMFRQCSDEQILLNNLKSKTLYMQFLGDHFIDEASIKSQMQQYLVEDMQQQDRIIAVQAVPPYQDLLENQYRLEITRIILNYGVSNLSWVWRFFKEETEESIEEKKKDLYLEIQRKIAETYLDRNNIKSCMIIVSRIQTAERLCRQFEIGKALCTICPDFGYVNEEATWKVQDSRMIVRWAQQPKDLIWVNMGEHKKQLINFFLFNFICFLLLLVSFFFIALTSTDTYFKMPTIIGPAILLILNSTLRFLISKMVQWQKKTLRSQWSLKQFKMTMVYFIINVILGSIIRDTLNVLGLLQTGWGWIQLFSLIYKQADGLFYYIFILNQTAVSFFTSLIKPGELFLDCYESSLWYDKVTKVKRKALFGRNDNYRLGYSYSLAFVVIAIVLIYSVSCPLIHIFGLIYFYSRMYLDTYSIIVFYEGEQQTSNLRIIQKVIQSISVLIGSWIFLTATSMIFSRNYSNAIVLYIFCGLVIYYAAILSKVASLKDARSDEIISKQDIRPLIEQWKRQYTHPFNLTRYEILIDALAGRQAFDGRAQFNDISSINPRRSSLMKRQ